ncbi:FAD-dependent oxidoreductase [Alkalihalobacillus deserti]|uniref:FAD-dependent oxidoreductase n=1 Tax=Alkalihalobacillus deserti TaxID=2879466 RepID=UPI001D156DD0|nr:FAD-dependent oxidoreductase [Alkalihalobacillus deserti]
MRPPSVHFFKKWGIYEEIESKSSKSDFMQVVACNGDILVSERWPLLTDNPDGKWARLIHRADLIETFLKQLPSDSIHLSHRLESITNHGNHAEIHFENGHSIEADLVIGADGILPLFVRSYLAIQSLFILEPMLTELLSMTKRHLN